MLVGIDGQHREAVHLPIRSIPSRPRTRNADGFEVDTADTSLNSLARAPVGLEDRLSGDDAVLPVVPGIAKTGLGRNRFTSGVVGAPPNRGIGGRCQLS